MSRVTPGKMRVARINLDTDTLHALLHLPDNMRILAEHIDPMSNSLVLFVESEDLPLCETGQVPPAIWLNLIGWHTVDRGEWYRAELQIPDSVQLLKDLEAGEP